MKKNTPKKINYVILISPRTGSTFFCDMLYNLNIMDKIDPFYEILHPDILKNSKKIPDKKFLINEFDKNRIKGMSGFKIMYGQLDKILTKKNIPIEKSIDLFPEKTKFIVITRRNVLRQAISFLKALKLNEWKKTNNPNKQKEISLKNCEIDRKIHELKKENLLIKKFCKVNNIEPLTLCYEDFADNKEIALKKILDYLDAKIENPIIKTSLVKQSDDVTEKIIKNYSGIMTKSKNRQKIYFLKRDILNPFYRLFSFIKRRIAKYKKVKN